MSNTTDAPIDTRTAAAHVAACELDLSDCADCQRYLIESPDSNAISDLAWNMVRAAGVEAMLCA
jgi:hypothetical protein